MSEVGINTVVPSNWAELEFLLEYIQSNRIEGFHVPLFRGQAKMEWKLESTLERAAKKMLQMDEYYRIVKEIQPKIAQFTGQKWEDVSEDASAKFWDCIEKDLDIPNYDYLVHLRHCGFPSPLLDWSKSPYVALYFACSTELENDGALYFLYKSRNEQSMRGPDFEYRKIVIFSDHVITHGRHFNQLARYSLAVASRPSMPQYLMVSHAQEVSPLQISPSFIFKVLISSNLKQEVLQKLNSFNINYFTIFGGEDGLIHSLADDIFLAKPPTPNVVSFATVNKHLRGL